MINRLRHATTQILRTGLICMMTCAVIVAAYTTIAKANDEPPVDEDAKQASPQALPKEYPFTEEDIVLAKECFAEAKSLSDKEGGKLWGKKLYGPFLFVDPQTRGILANEPDKEGRLVARDGVWVGKLPESENIAFTAYEWSGVRWTMIAWPPSKSSFVRSRLHTHEMFHRIQADVGLAPKTAKNGHLDTQDGRIWLRAEWRALRKAILSADEERRKAIEDALVFRQYRQSLFPEQADDECAFEMHEGMAEYTGFVASGMPREALLFQADMQLDQFDKRPAFVLTFGYGSGPAYGLLLDEATQTWRKGISPDTDLGELLAKAYRVTPPTDLAKEAEQRFKAYEGRKVIDEETKRAADRKRKLAEYQSRFVDGPTLTLAAAGRINWAYDPRTVTSFGKHGAVYETGRVTDNWGVLVVSGKGLLLITAENGMVEKALVSAPTDNKSTPIVGDGWTLTLEKGWELKTDKRKGDYVVARVAG